MSAEAMRTGDDLEMSGFRSVRELGRGASAIAYEAEELATGRRVCVKLFGTNLKPKERDRARLEHEVLRALEGHPHVLPALAVKQTPEGRMFMVTALLVGRTLHEELQARGKLPEAEAITLGLELLDGLAAAHALGVVHRDIKPANLFVVTGPPRRLVVMDFGLAKVHEVEASGPGGARAVRPLTDPTTAGLMLGTPRYMAPEQILAQPVDARADLYAAALVIYRCACGRGPFDEAKGLLDLAQAQLLTVPELPSKHAPALSAGLDDILMRALAKRREDRFASASEMIAALRGLSRGAEARQRALSPPTEALPAGASAHRFSADAPTAALDLRGSEPFATKVSPSSAAVVGGVMSGVTAGVTSPAHARSAGSLDALTAPIPGLAIRQPGPSAPGTYPSAPRAGGATPYARALGAVVTSEAEPMLAQRAFWSFGSSGWRLVAATAVVAVVAVGILAAALHLLK